MAALVVLGLGFTPKGAVVTVAGELERDSGTLILAGSSEEREAIEPGATAPCWAALQAVADGASVEVRGEVGEPVSGDRPWVAPRLRYLPVRIA